MRTIHQALHYATPKLKNAGVDTPSLDAEVMLSHILQCSRTDVLAHPEKEISDFSWQFFEEWLERRANREPLAYIIGEREFFGICFKVSPGVLIPRQETEFLVEIAIDLLNKLEEPKAADIGLGSGAIAVSIAKSIPQSVVYGTELSSTAFNLAYVNAKMANVECRVEFRQGDLFDPMTGLEFDLIVSNPPYIPSSEIDNLQPEIAKYEPREALDGGPDGLDCLRRIIEQSPTYLKPNGALAVEVGDGQSSAVQEIFAKHDFTEIRAVEDYGGIERVVIGKRGA